MDSYDQRVKKLQTKAMADLQAEFAKADAVAAKDPARAERKVFAVELGKAREVKKLSQVELATQVGITQPELSRIENAKGNPSLNTLLLIAKALDANLVLD